MTTRANTEVYLIGQENSSLPKSKIPSRQEVLQVFFHHHRTESQTVNESIRFGFRRVIKLWQKAFTPTVQDYNALKKPEKLFRNWKLLIKERSRKSAPQIAKENKFKNDTPGLFDVAHQNTLSMTPLKKQRV